VANAYYSTLTLGIPCMLLGMNMGFTPKTNGGRFGATGEACSLERRSGDTGNRGAFR